MTPRTSLLLRLAFLATAATSLVSCASQEAYSGLEEDPQPAAQQRDAPRVVSAQPSFTEEEEEVVVDLREVRANIISQRLVFFEFDKYVVSTEYLGMITAHSDYLISNRGYGVFLQGHADERGSTEYNLALGQRRADAIREIMLAAGVYADQIETISYGEERPRALGHNEGAWSENRRVEIVYTDE